MKLTKLQKIFIAGAVLCGLGVLVLYYWSKLKKEQEYYEYEEQEEPEEQEELETIPEEIKDNGKEQETGN